MLKKFLFATSALIGLSSTAKAACDASTVCPGYSTEDKWGCTHYLYCPANTDYKLCVSCDEEKCPTGYDTKFQKIADCDMGDHAVISTNGSIKGKACGKCSCADGYINSDGTCILGTCPDGTTTQEDCALKSDSANEYVFDPGDGMLTTADGTICGTCTPKPTCSEGYSTTKPSQASFTFVSETLEDGTKCYKATGCSSLADSTKPASYYTYTSSTHGNITCYKVSGCATGYGSPTTDLDSTNFTVDTQNGGSYYLINTATNPTTSPTTNAPVLLYSCYASKCKSGYTDVSTVTGTPNTNFFDYVTTKYSGSSATLKCIKCLNDTTSGEARTFGSLTCYAKEKYYNACINVATSSTGVGPWWTDAYSFTTTITDQDGNAVSGTGSACVTYQSGSQPCSSDGFMSTNEYEHEIVRWDTYSFTINGTEYTFDGYPDCQKISL